MGAAGRATGRVGGREQRGAVVGGWWGGQPDILYTHTTQHPLMGSPLPNLRAHVQPGRPPDPCMAAARDRRPLGRGGRGAAQTFGQRTRGGPRCPGSHRQLPPSTKAAPRGTWSGRLLPHRRRHRGQPPELSSLRALHADPISSGPPPGPCGAPPTWSRRHAPGDRDNGPTSGRWRRHTRRSRVWSQRGSPQPKLVSRLGREDTQAGRGAQTGKARDRKGKGTRETVEGRLGEKPQAKPGHQENMATESHRHRYEGGPVAPRLGSRTAPGTHRDPPHEPGSHHRDPKVTSATNPMPGPHCWFLVHPPTLSSSGRLARPPLGTLPMARRPNPVPRKRSCRHRSLLLRGAGGEPAGSGVGHAPDGTPGTATARAASQPLGRRSGPAGSSPASEGEGTGHTVGDEPPSVPTAEDSLKRESVRDSSFSPESSEVDGGLCSELLWFQLAARRGEISNVSREARATVIRGIQARDGVSDSDLRARKNQNLPRPMSQDPIRRRESFILHATSLH
nr:LOW QUALITY PROTEIN: dapper homolog 3-like [Pan paniscus]